MFFGWMAWFRGEQPVSFFTESYLVFGMRMPGEGCLILHPNVLVVWVSYPLLLASISSWNLFMHTFGW